MNSLNSIIVEGNVVRKPEIKETSRGTPVCTMTVAVNRTYKTVEGVLQKEVYFFDVDTWGQLARVCAETCDKGRGVRVVGRLKQDRWQDSEGKNRSKIRIVAEHVEFKPKFTGAQNSEAEDLHKSYASGAPQEDLMVADPGGEEAVF
ncbi:MAG: single-stranded DNA-binding protein [Spirochaetaceae bacterium]|jgi:single-strand DNA-binding protein|nr:single-stranded DNA-binding protein [Spirochaetaceae bacterium]